MDDGGERGGDLGAAERPRRPARGSSVAGLAHPQRLTVIVPGFGRVGSEDRLSFGFDDAATALAADLRSAEPGVTASGPIPADLPARLRAARTVSAAYGTQRSGPHPAPPAEVREALASACADIAAAVPSALPEAPADASSPQAAATVVETYFALLAAGRAGEADRLWETDGAAAARRSLGAKPSAEVYAPGEPRGAAGSVYIEVPVHVTAGGGGRAGTVTLRRANEVPGSLPSERRWCIEKLALGAAEPAGSPALDPVYAYRCADGRQLVVRFAADAAVIERGLAPPLRPPRRQAASGVRYAGEAVSIAGKGAEILYEADETPPTRCVGESVTAPR